MNITGRMAEQRILATMLASSEPELIAIYGRCRVGKTYRQLIRLFVNNDLIAYETQPKDIP